MIAFNVLLILRINILLNFFIYLFLNIQLLDNVFNFLLKYLFIIVNMYMFCENINNNTYCCNYLLLHNLVNVIK